MLTRLLMFAFGGFLFFLVSSIPAMAVDTDAEALQFIEPDAAMVMAMDIDEVLGYSHGVLNGWRPADQAHFFEALNDFSYLVASEGNKPDVLTFFSRLEGVQAMQFTGESNFPLLIFSSGSERDLDTIALYTYAYILEDRLGASLSRIHDALNSYYYRAEEDPETGEITYPYTYPATIDDLIEFGYLESIPINPYTGEPIRIIGEGDQGEPGDVYYMPQTYGFEDDGYSGYDARSYRLYGVNVREDWDWKYTLEAYDDYAGILRDFGREYDFETMGFIVEAVDGWTYVSRDDADYAFAYGATNLLFGATVDGLKDSVERFESGSGFSFGTPDEFDVSDAFFVTQADIQKAFRENMPQAEMPDFGAAMDRVIDSMGMEALGMDYTAAWLQDSDIVCRRWCELTGEAEGTYMSRILTAEPEELMTAQNGPLELIGEVAFANPDDFVEAYMDFLFENVFPEIQEAFGAEGVDPGEIAGMLGLGNIQALDIGDQLYVLMSASAERENGAFVPGISAAINSENEDMAYIMVGIMDTLSMMVPDFPFIQAQYGDENAFTWLCECEVMPITPTIAWTDGWIIKGLWREDVLAIREAIDAGEMFTPDGMDPANMRVYVNRQELLRGLADIMYAIDEDETPFVGAFFEMAAQLSHPDERLYMEYTGYEDHLEARSEFSIDLFENMIPVMAYVLKGMRESGI